MTENTSLEFHDSVLEEVHPLENGVVLRFAPAYIHVSTGLPGVDAGTVWLQDYELRIHGAALHGDSPGLPCRLDEGSLVHRGQRMTSLLPIPFETKGAVELELLMSNGTRVTISGTDLICRGIGERKYLEQFRP